MFYDVSILTMHRLDKLCYLLRALYLCFCVYVWINLKNLLNVNNALTVDKNFSKQKSGKKWGILNQRIEKNRTIIPRIQIQASLCVLCWLSSSSVIGRTIPPFPAKSLALFPSLIQSIRLLPGFRGTTLALMFNEPEEFALWGEFSAGKLIFGAVMAEPSLSLTETSRVWLFPSAADGACSVLDPVQPSLMLENFHWLSKGNEHLQFDKSIKSDNNPFVQNKTNNKPKWSLGTLPRSLRSERIFCLVQK